MGFTELLKNKDIDQKMREEFTSTIHRNSVELGALIDDMLDLSKVEAGRMELSRDEIKIADLMRDIKDSLSLEAHLKNHRLPIERKAEA